ncbi:hypothetical protein BDV26DRAFT_304096 [Aspergillus bertholletiae]|uniref:Protein kinase domain-containing protein n=1 Tax=Aspergillus bertholletiae TaxID=1226010 RepID=A0A5N7BAK0_9EURO|nr:hypothetical protein BDV26DRAFT_304096 [Aspergillus bertholletiae]
MHRLLRRERAKPSNPYVNGWKVTVGGGHSAQLVLVEVISDGPLKGLERGKRVVAKIYDPLYLNYNGGSYGPFVWVDNHYTHEVAAYKIFSDVQGSMVPSTTELSQQDRQNIMKAIVQFDTLAYTRGMVLPDLQPRNVMVTNTTTTHEKAVCVDFGDVLFGRGNVFNSPVVDAHLLLGTYISPLLRWHEAFRTRMLDFAGWIDWDWQPWLETEFKHTASTITPKIREAFLPNHVLETW